MEKDVIYVIESQDYIFVADTLEKAEEIADRLVMDAIGRYDFKRKYIKRDPNLECKDPYDRSEAVYYDDDDDYSNKWVATIRVCKMNFCRYDKNGRYIHDYSFGDEV